jgi:outer membrane protein OmpA-like peptidoglycan-associated protein
VSRGIRHRATAAGILPAVAFACLVADGARAQDFSDGPPYSIDIEFLRPQFGHEGFVGVDAPIANRNLTFRYGTVLQYEQAPLTLYEALDDQELGAVVTNRFSGLFGASIDVNRVTFSLLIPTAANWGTEVPNFAQDGFGLGNVGASVKVVALQTPNDVFNVGARVGLILPVGRQNAYIAEDRLRTNLGLLASLGAGPIRFASDFSIGTRTTVRTSEDFVAANEIMWGNAVRLHLPDASRLGLNAQLLARAGMTEFLRGGAENALEAIGGIEFYPSRAAVFGVGAGRGLTEGYGTTDFRVLTHLTIQIPPGEPLPPRYGYEEPPRPTPPPPIDVIVEDPPEVVFEEDELVKQVGEEIFIRNMIEFIVDTNVIQEYSKDDLAAVADLINDNPKIANVIVEGHASQEGDYQHNYMLAESRARAIWEFFMGLGVAKERIAYRGMGEVEPVLEDGQPVLGVDEASLQKNRRVRFLVTRQFDDPSLYPTYPDQQVLPWSGEVVKVIKPVVEAPPPEPEGPKLDEFGLPIHEDDIDIGTPEGDEE